MGEESRESPLRSLEDLKPGDHVCWICEEEEEFRTVLIPLIRGGIRRGERVIYGIASCNPESPLDRMREGGFDPYPFLKNGCLSIIPYESFFPTSESLDLDRMVLSLKELLEDTLKKGYSALRGIGEITSSIATLEPQAFMEYEAKLNYFIPTSRFLAICRYNLGEFDPSFLLSVLKTHPIVIANAKVYDNIYYIPPDKLLGANAPEEELRSLLRNLEIRREEMERLRFLSTHDPLTGLYNRMYFEEEISRLERGRQFPISIIMVDVDDLKLINDTQGHAAGDEILKMTADVLKRSFRAEDIISRIGGDEFAVLLPNTDSGTAQRILDRLKEKVNLYNQRVGIALSLSFGVATGEKGSALMEVLKQADHKMYMEKLLKDSRKHGG